MVAVIIRSIERIFAVLSGILSIYLGYLLFLQIPNEVNSQGQVTLPGGTAIYLSRIGPGAFLALFGAIVVAISLTRPVKLDETKKIVNLSDIEKKKNEIDNAVKEIEVENNKVEQVLRNKEYKESTEKIVALAPAIIDSQKLDELQKEFIASLNAKRDMLRINILDKLPSLIRTDLSDKQIMETRLSLMQTVWDSDWGDFYEFRAWVENGASEPLSEKLDIKKEAVDYYKGRRATP